jgi:hypothetical protein
MRYFANPPLQRSAASQAAGLARARFPESGLEARMLRGTYAIARLQTSEWGRRRQVRPCKF